MVKHYKANTKALASIEVTVIFYSTDEFLAVNILMDGSHTVHTSFQLIFTVKYLQINCISVPSNILYWNDDCRL